MAGFGRYIDIRRVGYAGSNSVIYDDLQVSISTARILAGSTAAWDDITLDGFSTQLMAFQTDDYCEILVQTTHAVKLQTAIDNHIHWTMDSDDAGDEIAFEVTGVAAGINSAFASIGTLKSNDYTLLAGDGLKHKLLEIGHFPTTPNTTVSTCYIIRLTRVAPADGTDSAKKVFLIFNDCHIEKDTLGSLQETSKI